VSGKGWRLAVGLSVGASALASTLAHGATASHTAWVTMAGSETELDALTEALREPLDSLGLSLRVSRAHAGASPETEAASAHSNERARISIDARSADHIDILLWAGPIASSAPVRRVLARELPRPSDAVEAEEVAYAVRAALESLLSEPAPPEVAAPLPVPPPHVENTTPTTPDAVTEERYVSVDVAAFGSVRGLATSTPAFGGGLATDVALWARSRWRPGLWIEASVEAPVTTTTNLVSLSTTLSSFRVVPNVELVRVGPIRLGAGVGAGLDLLHITPSPSGTSAATLRPSSTYADPILEAELAARVRIGDGAGLFASIALDYDTAPHHFTEQDGPTTHDVLAPWSVRPAMLIGFCIPLAAASKCAREK